MKTTIIAAILALTANTSTAAAIFDYYSEPCWTLTMTYGESLQTYPGLTNKACEERLDGFSIRVVAGGHTVLLSPVMCTCHLEGAPIGLASTATPAKTE